MALADLGQAQTDLGCPNLEERESQAGKSFPGMLHWGNHQDFHL